MTAKRTAFRALVVFATAIAATFALTGSAFAATVHGADYQGSGATVESGQINVLNVDGSAGETVFLSVLVGNTAIAKNLPYTVGENAKAGDESSWAGVATLDIDGLNLEGLAGTDPNTTYSVEAYDSRANGTQLYKGTLYGVYADLPDGTTKLIGTRTVNASEAGARAFNAPDTVFVNGHTYRQAGAPTGEGALHFPYAEYDEATTVDGSIKYVDSKGAVVSSSKVPGLAYGEERTVDIPAVVVSDKGDVYRTVFFKDSVTVKNPGSTSYTVYCTQMAEADKALAGYYVATIQMVDENGRVIATDSVNVTGNFVYTAPASIYKTEEQADGRPAVVTYKINGSQTLYFSAAADDITGRTRTVQVKYSTEPLEQASTRVSFNRFDGSKRANEKGRSLGTETAVVDEANATALPAETIEANGTTYHIVGSPSDYAYSFRSGAMPSVNVYYLPEGYHASESYEVTVNYVNYVTGDTVESHTYTSEPNTTSALEIETPETFSANGVDYVRLPGQEGVIEHNYYSHIPSYTVYYRDVNDVLTSGTVINTIRVDYVDGPGGGGLGDGTGATTAADAAAADAQALQLNDGRTYNVFDGEGNNGLLTNESGVDSNTERIEDNETPLASGFDKGATSSAASSLTQLGAWALPIGIGLAVVIAAVAVITILRRRKDDDYYL